MPKENIADSTTVIAKKGTKGERPWLREIEILKGIAIVLVVWGHVNDPAFPAWALGLRRAVYSFHMPLFMFLSGFIFIYIGAHELRGSFWKYCKARARRLLIPFFVMALIVVALKYAGGIILPLDRPVEDVLVALSNIFYHTEESPAQFIWYVFVLFIFSTITPIAIGVLTLNIYIILSLSLIMYLLHIFTYNRGISLDYLYLNRVIMYYVFFIWGCAASLHRDRWNDLVDRYWLWASIPLLGVVYIFFNSEWRYLFAGFFSTVFFHGLVRRNFMNSIDVLVLVGQNAFAIYLLNTIFVAFVKAVHIKILWGAEHAFLVLVTSTAAGVIGPILVRHVFQRIKFTRFIAVAMS